MATKKSKQARGVIPYARRAIEDQYVDEQLRTAIARLGDAYRRISRQQADAAQDKQLYRNLREAATSVRNVVRRVEEPPPPPKRRRTLMPVGVGAAAAMLLVKRARRRKSDLPLETDSPHEDAASRIDRSDEQTPAHSAA